MNDTLLVIPGLTRNPERLELRPAILDSRFRVNDDCWPVLHTRSNAIRHI